MPPTMKPLQPFRMPPKAPSKIGVPPDPSTTNPGQATSISLNQPDTLVQSFTYVTTASVETQVLYTADRPWVQVTLALETGGPVAVGVQSTLQPVSNSPGILLPNSGEPRTFWIAKGNKIYISSTSVNRVTVVISPLPWLQQLTALLTAVFQTVQALLSKP